MDSLTEKYRALGLWRWGYVSANQTIQHGSRNVSLSFLKLTFINRHGSEVSRQGRGKMRQLTNVYSPYKFEAPWNAWEFAYHILHRQANLVVVSMAWLTREDAHSYSQTPMDPDMETLSYWVTRLEPLIRREDKGEIIVVFANRTGIEGDAIYAGTSAVLGIEAGEVKLYGILGRGEQGLLVVDTSKMPQAKLVYETNTTDSSANTTDSSESRSTESSITDPDDSVPSISEVLSGMAPISPVEPKSPHSFFSSQPAKAEDRHTLHSSIAHEEDHSQSLQSSKENSYQDLESALNGGNRCDNSTPAPESQFEWFCSPTSRNASQNASRNCEPIAQERTLLGHDLAVESEHIVDADHAQLDSRNVLGNKGAVSVNPVLLGGDEQEKEVHGLMPYRELGARAMRPKSMGW